MLSQALWSESEGFGGLGNSSKMASRWHEALQGGGVAGQLSLSPFLSRYTDYFENSPNLRKYPLLERVNPLLLGQLPCWVYADLDLDTIIERLYTVNSASETQHSFHFVPATGFKITFIYNSSIRRSVRCLANHNVAILPTKYNRKLLLGSTLLADSKAFVIKNPVMSLVLALAITHLLFACLIPSATLDLLRYSIAKCIMVQEVSKKWANLCLRR